MAILLLGLVLFLGMHSVSIVAEGFRDRMAQKSLLGWKAFYALVSVIGLVLIGKGYAAARLDPVLLYTTPNWFGLLTYLMVLPAFILFFVPYFPGRINQSIPHPQLIAVKLWALSHLLVNGMLADVVLFGSFLLWAGADRVSMKRRAVREVPGLRISKLNDLIVVILGLVSTALFVAYLHSSLIGMPLVTY